MKKGFFFSDKQLDKYSNRDSTGQRVKDELLLSRADHNRSYSMTWEDNMSWLSSKCGFLSFFGHRWEQIKEEGY